MIFGFRFIESIDFYSIFLRFIICLGFITLNSLHIKIRIKINIKYILYIIILQNFKRNKKKLQELEK